jgi:trehalose 6-phosphate phosphatase
MLEDGAVDRMVIVEAVRAELARALIALDFDGTLAPIIADPTRSKPVAGTVRVLTALALAGAQVAVITGRDARTAVELGGLSAVPRIAVSGLYGLESWSDGRLSTIDEPPALGILRERLPGVVMGATSDEQVWIEDKRLSLVVHARKAADPAAQVALVREPVMRLAAELGLETHGGRGVLEIRIPGYDKGTALRRLVAEHAPSIVLFAGDDVGDLPAFEVVRELRGAGTTAWSVAIKSAEAAEVSDAADLTVESPASLVALLGELVR